MRPKNKNKAILSALLSSVILFTACGSPQEPTETPATDPEPAPAAAPAAPANDSEASEAVEIALSDAQITVDGTEAPQTPSGAVYTAHDIIY